jgi:hypothetical protein
MTISIRETNLTYKKDLKEFIELPWSIYKNDPHWVPPLKMALKDMLNLNKHPFYKTAKVKTWLAEKDGKIVGRIMAINNSAFNSFQKTKIGHFGFFESIDDQAVANLLLNTAEAYLKAEGLTSVQGPMNPGTNYECGLLVKGFEDAPQIMMTYNPRYYQSQIENLGYRKTMDLLAYNINADFKMADIILKIADRTEKKSKVTYRNVNKKNWTKEIEILFDIYNDAWEENWGFVPMTKEEFFHTAKDLKSIVDENLVQIAEVNGEPAGFILTLPDLNQVFKQIPNGNLLPTGIFKLISPKKYINRVRVITMGIKKQYRRIGLETLLYKYNQIEILKNPRIKNIEMSWILENNLEMNKPLITMGAKAYKSYRIFEKNL